MLFQATWNGGIMLISCYIISLKLHRNDIVEIENKNLAKTWDLFLSMGKGLMS